ncbi:hypothetical protein GX586_07220 [bacterium]|nr:hypothetical protein [bacterium]
MTTLRLRPFLLVLCAAFTAHAVTIWVEGEQPARSDVTRHSWYNSVKTDALSGGAWLSHYDRSKPGTAEYDILVPETRNYTFWLRGNPHTAKVSYRIDQGPWTEIDWKKDFREYMNIAADNKFDMRFLEWVKLGVVRLEQGTRTISFKTESEVENHGAIDCFCLTTDAFVPSGATQPGAGSTKEVPAGPDEAVWIEGENAVFKDVTEHPWWYDKVSNAFLSGGAWLHHFSELKPGNAEYSFTISTPDKYSLWLRANPSGAKLACQVDAGEWKEIDMKGDVRENRNIAEDGKVDLRFIAWVNGGTHQLDAGMHTIRFRMHSENSNHGAIDCLVLSRVPFAPSGTNRPTMKIVANDPGDWFPVVFENDQFSPESVIDMSSLVEAPAGTHGFLKRAGANLKFENADKPVKFWGCGANLQYGSLSREQQAQRAKYLRKHGVNMVRQHPVLGDVGPLRNGQFDQKRIDEFDFYFSEMKKNGIYMTWSVFYPLLVSADDGYDPELFAELEEKENGLRSASGLVNVERGLQDLQLKYVAALLEHTNAYTGLCYADDPALAVLEIQNEDCVFWGAPLNVLAAGMTFPRHSMRLRQRWFAWATNLHGSVEAVRAAWNGLAPKDAPDKGEFALMASYHLGGQGPLYEFQGMTARAGDYVRFLTEIQREFYDRREKEMRSLGFKGVTVTTAWRAGGAGADPANTYCDTACDMIDRHNYFGGGVGGHNIADGKVNNGTHFVKPGSGLLASGLYQVEDRPFCMTEWSQCPPNQWKLEASPLIAFYGMGLQGWDASYHFLNGRERIGDGWPNLSSYVTDTPHYIGQFPAIAFALYNGHIKEGDVAAARRITVDDLFKGVDPLMQDFTGGGHDDKTLQGALSTPEEMLAIGKVTCAFEGGAPEQIATTSFWNKTAKTVTSTTGELVWDYGRQLVTLRTPRTQAIIGRSGGKAVILPAVGAKIKTPFVSMIFTPLDNKELAQSSHILITALAQDTQMNAKYNEDGSMLITVGAPPLLLEPVQALVKFRGPAPKEIVVLDQYGVPTDRRVKLEKDGSFTIDGTYQAYYYEVKR